MKEPYKYLEISGNIAGRIELETEKDLLIRRAMVIDGQHRFMRTSGLR